MIWLDKLMALLIGQSLLALLASKGGYYPKSKEIFHIFEWIDLGT